METHAFARSAGRKSFAVISDAKGKLPARAQERHINLIRFAVFDRVRHSFLRDSIKSERHRLVGNVDGVWDLKVAPDLILAGAKAKLAQRCR